MATPVRIATFNASLNRATEGGLIADLSTPNNAQAQTVAEIIQRAAPDIILINEFDFDAAGPGGASLAAQLFQQNYLGVGQNGAEPIVYPYVYVAASNTGIASGFDLNNNGVAVTTPGAAGYGDDALGFGAFPGQFGMAVFSKYPIDLEAVRTFQNFLWQDMPDARLPDNPATPEPNDWYSPEELAILRLSSKSHWDIPVIVDGETVHILAAHPTPPVFDGPEDRNGLRNADEIRFWSDYVQPDQGNYIYDDAGQIGGLAAGERFVIVGDYNADPNDGDSVDSAALQILNSSAVDPSVIPTSPGAVEQSALQGGANTAHAGDPIFDTADFADNTPGNLRVDYVLPSRAGLDPQNGGVFWPLASDPTFPLVGTFNPALPGGFPSSDHRLVYLDVSVLDEANLTMLGDRNNNVIVGDGGNDSLAGAAGDDVLEGSDGSDTLAGDAGADSLSGGEGGDDLAGGAGADSLAGEEGDDSLSGGAGNDRLDGGAGEDTVGGGAGQDTLSGGEGDDELNGGAGSDLLAGGAGNDVLMGGAGSDRFLFVDVGDGVDLIAQFSLVGVEDQLVLGSSMFEGFAGGDASDLIDGGFLRAMPGLGSSTEIQVDSDGGGDAFQTIAVVNVIMTNGSLADHTIVGGFLL